MTATEAKAKFLALLDDIERGDEVVITRHGVTIARLSPARGPHALLGKFAGVARTIVPDEQLYSTGEEWEAS